MNQRGKRLHVFFAVTTLFSLLCFPSLLLAQTEHPLRLIQPGGTGGSAPSSGAPTSPTSGDTAPIFHDIHGPIQLADPVPWLLYALVAVFTIGLLAGLWWWFRIRKQPVPPAIPPSVRARDELMRAREMMTSDLQLHYMERVSAILRTYLEQRFQLPTSRQTTREFFATIGRGSTKYAELKRYNIELKNCLEQCDLAKFAHRSATVESLQEMEDGILRFINRTEQPATEPWQTESKGVRA